MASELTAAPVLSTPADHLFELVESGNEGSPRLQVRSHDELFEVYEVARTAQELRVGGWRRIALQFPDSMLSDAPWVVEALKDELESPCALESSPDGATHAAPEPNPPRHRTADETRAQETEDATRSNTTGNKSQEAKEVAGRGGKAVERNETGIRIYIMADTSYSACCVDEIAAEHIAADVVVHYGRSCLSPTTRLPVVYVFTRQQLRYEDVTRTFEHEFSDKQAKVVLAADVTYQDHIPSLTRILREAGYTNLLSTSIIRDPQGRIPNRKILNLDEKEFAPIESRDDLKEYSVFHVANPPTALLLALSSRVKSLHIYATSEDDPFASTSSQVARRLLGRRYARLLSLSTAGVIGILVNTLSVSNYLASIDLIRKQIAAAGKKSYTVVVGKLNPAKLANFAEIDGWVVVGCWESSLVEDDAGFFKPVITPFELDAALTPDDKRVWGAEWWGGIETVQPPDTNEAHDVSNKDAVDQSALETKDIPISDGYMDEEESEPPEFDLRTGKLVSHSRPMKVMSGHQGREAAKPGLNGPSNTLALRPKADLAMVNGVASPGAEYLRSQRTWQGLGSDFAVDEASTAIEEGRSGVARGYVVGDSANKS